MKKVTIRTIKRIFDEGGKVVMVTAYDATMARIMDDAGVDAILVGDSLGMVIQGHDSTLPVRLEHILYHTQAVCKGTKRAHIVADMPFMSYQCNHDEAVRNAGRLLSEGGAEAVKLEGGSDYYDVVQRITRAGIPVMGHVGLTPQSVHKLGGYGVQGKTEDSAKRIKEDVLALQDAGCYAVVLECVPMELALEITNLLSIPTIGIGAGPHCGGQVLVGYDLLGFNPDFSPVFLKKYLSGYESVKEAAQNYAMEVREGLFPAPENTFVQKREKGRVHEVGAGREIRVLDGEKKTEKKGCKSAGRIYG